MQTRTINIPALEELTLEEKIGQMFLIDFSGYKLDDRIREHFSSIPWGGVILFTKNVKSRGHLTELNRSLLELNGKIPILISVDQEGGIVVRPNFPDMHLSPGNMPLGKIGDPGLVEELAAISGLEIRELGFHLNYAPVADVDSNPDNPIIGVRSFGDDPEMVGEMAVAAIRGYRAAGIASCVKHFPGHGDTSFDSHILLSRVDAPLKRLEKVELPPFKKAIDEGVDSVMTAHVIYPALDESELPATLSKKILTDLLREKMGFKGLIITDSMAMKAISDNFGTGKAAVMSVQAGSDIVMMLGDFKKQVIAYRAVLDAVEKGTISQERIDDSVERILEFKRKFIVKPSPPLEIPIDARKKALSKASRGSITVVYGEKNLPLILDSSRTLVLSPDKLYYTEVDKSNTRWSVYPYLNDATGQLKRCIYSADSPEEQTRRLVEENWDHIILELYSRAPLSPEKKDLWGKIIRDFRNRGSKVVIISLLSHYGFPQNAHVLITGYSYLSLTMEMIAQKLVS